MRRAIVRFLKWYFRDELWRFYSLEYSLETMVDNSGIERDWKIRMLSARVFRLEQHLELSNSFHSAEISHPEDGFKWLETWKLKDDTAWQRYERKKRAKEPS